MPMWPFGRKGRGSRAAKVKEARATSVADRQRPVAALPATRTSSDAPRRMPSQRSTRRRRRSSRSTTTSLRDVEKNSPTVALADPSAFAKESSAFGTLPPGRRSSIEDITALPHQKRLEQSPHLRPVTLEHGIPYNFQATSHSSLPTARDRGKLQRPQSLRKSVPVDTGLIRRKSSKRRRENDHLREEEIRAMSLPLPQKRSAGSSGGLLRRDSKKVKGALNHRFERPTSNVSLPFEDSIHSSMSGNSETRAFRVSTLDMFSPRPTIRYSVGSQYYYGSGTGGGSSSSPTGYQARNDVRRDRGLTASRDGDHHTTNHQRKHSRIDDLADTLDAGALREILDRDKRRREKKRKQEDERLRRRLERRAEKQKAAEAAAAVSGTPATPNREAIGAIGLGIEREALSTPTPMDDVRPSTPQPSQRLETAGLAPKAELNSQLPTPLDSPMEEPVVSDARAVRYSRGSVSSPVHTRGPSNVSEMPELLSEKIAQETAVPSVEPVQDPSASGSLHPVETTETTATSKKGSSRRRSSEGRRMSVFASIFRRSKRNSQDQGVNTPSEVSFSNTSRESMSRQPIPAHLVAAGPRAQPVQIKRPSSVPRRTRSKFREDLPEFPLSPPDSRVQSPEVPALNTAAVRRSSQALHAQINDTQAGDRSDSPVSPGVPATGIMSQSLASVDSEGSWLSGKPMKRRSNKSQQMRNSVASSTAVKRNEEFSASYEELGIPDDEYFRRLTPSPDERRRSAHSADMLTKRASSTAMAALDTNAGSDDEQNQTTSSRRSNEEEVVHTVGRQPTIVHRQARVKSREGLLIDGEKVTLQGTPAIADSADPDSPTSETEPVTPVTLQRARSVDLGKHHARHLSAGSAKLLDIHKRSSTASQSNNKPVEQE